jgi:hypothetical protein
MEITPKIAWYPLMIDKNNIDNRIMGKSEITGAIATFIPS